MSNILNLATAESEPIKESTAEPIFYTTEDIARLLGCSIGTAREIMYRNDFPLLKIGKNNKVLKSAFIEWAKTKRV